MLLHLFKHLIQRIANMIQKLSKLNDGANPIAFHMLLHVIKYVLDIKNLDLKLELTEDASKT